MHTRRGAVNPAPPKEDDDNNPARDEEKNAPTVTHELALTKLQLEAEKERGRLREETIVMLKSDKNHLQKELTSKDEFPRELLKNGNRSMEPSSSSGDSSKVQSQFKRVLVFDDDSEVALTLAIDSPLSDSSLEDDSKKKKKKFKKKRSPKLAGSPISETSRVRVKTCTDIIKRYKAVLKKYNEGGSMKAAFEEVSVDRNTIARTAVIAELSLAAPEAFIAVGQWNEKSEKLAAFVDRCRAIITIKCKGEISKMKEKGTLLPIAH
uniref:coiled-coil domain-containing protein 106-like n=1 Tax=Epinephelus lanceolatus TaxID=310571 RepID=UPI0014478EA6|nr:coiled-coil domain-containing protein 106-like [Epinephelus lanceolatus]